MTDKHTESQSVDQARPYFRLAGHLDDAIREGRRDDARALAVSIARLLGAEIPAAIECKSMNRGENG
jgi:hypothetical protein